MKGTIQERVRAMQKRAAMKRAESGTARPSDDLLLRPDDFTKREASEIRGYERGKKVGGYSYLSPDSRGQRLSNKKFEDTYGSSAYDNKYGVGYSSPASGSKSYQKRTGQSPDYFNQAGVFSSKAPRMEENEDPTAYRMRYLTWERDEARTAFNETVKKTKGSRDSQEHSENVARTNAFQNKGANTQSKTRVNPEYAKLTTAEKEQDQRYFEKTGKHYVSPTTDISSGRSPINTNKLTMADRKAQKSFNAKISRLQDEIKNGVLSDEAASAFTAAEQPFLSDYMNHQKKIADDLANEGKDEEGHNQMGDEMKEIRLLLGATDDQDVAFDENGDPYLVEDGEKYDPVERAKEKLEQKKKDDADDLVLAYKNQKAVIENRNRIDGKITEQGQRQLDELKRRHLKKLRQLEDSWDEKIEDEILNEKKNQFNIDKRIEGLMSPENVIKEAAQKELLREARGIMNSGAAVNWTGALSQARAMQKTNAKNPKKAEQFKEIDRKIFTPGFDRSEAFSTAAAVLGYDSGMIKEYMKSRSFTDKDIVKQTAEYQKDVLGYTQEEVEAERDDFSIQEILQKDSEELTDEELDFLQEYEINYPKKAARWKMKILNPEMTDAEIWSTVEKDFGDEKKKTISGAKNELFDTQYQKYKEEGKTDMEAYRLANKDVSGTFATKKTSGGTSSGTSVFSDAEGSLEEALGTGLIKPEEADSFLMENFPKLKSASRDAIKKKFVRYNSSSQKYESLVSPDYKKETEDTIDRIMADEDLSAVDSEKKRQFNRKKLGEGEFVDGVFVPKKELKLDVKKPEPKKSGKKEFNRLYAEAMEEIK